MASENLEPIRKLIDVVDNQMSYCDHCDYYNSQLRCLRPKDIKCVQRVRIDAASAALAEKEGK